MTSTVERIEDDSELRDHTLPPHDLQAEEAILGAVLKRPEVIGSLLHLSPVEFYSPRYRTIWRAMLDLWHRNVPIDHTVLAARLKHRDFDGAHVSGQDLADIDLAAPMAANVAYYAQLVANAATQRRFISAAQQIAERAWPAGVDVEDLAQRAEALIAGARPSASAHDLFSPERWGEAFNEDLEARMIGQRTSVGTGLLDLDAMTLGLESGGLYLLMGTPGLGKSELSLQIAIHVAQKHGPVLFASLEMTAVELAQRYVRITRGIDRNRLAKGQLTDEETKLVLEAIEEMRRLPLWPASPRGRYTTADLRADALEIRSKAGHVALIVADYVQRFDDGDGNPSHREINVGMVAKGLKSLAREFGCPVLAPVQPNREYVARQSKRPLLSDLRESGKLEQEADVVLGLYRDEKHNEVTRERGIAEVHMLKNRSGVGDSEGMRRLVWKGSKYANFAAAQHDALPWNAGQDE